MCSMEKTKDLSLEKETGETQDSKSPKKHEKMHSKDKVRNSVYLWDKKPIEELLHSVTLATTQKDVDLKQLESADHQKDKYDQSGQDITSDIRFSDKMSCITCAASFLEREEQIEHFKSDWHRFNLKKRLKGQENVTESRFEEITNSGDLSSISGSESSGEDEDVHQVTHKPAEEEGELECHIEGIGKRHPRVFLRNATGELLSIFRCVIHGKKNQAESVEDLVSMVTNLPGEMIWSVIMMAGGHFAAAIFDGATVVVHKTFHRYVVRAKRGTVQSSRDGKGSAPKSGGASLRRYNEAALTQEIQDLLNSWSQQIRRCHRIFIRAPTYSKSVFYGGKVPVFDKHDQRIRLIPFQTRRPTFKELNRVHELLATVQCYGTDSTIEDHISSSPKKPAVTTAKCSPDLPQLIAPVSIPDDSGSQADKPGSEEDVTLVVESLTINTRDELQEFDNPTKPRKKKKSSKPKQVIDDPSPIEKFTDPDSKDFRNRVYTACKTKNTDQLQTLLQDINTKNNTPEASASSSGENHPDIHTLSARDTSLVIGTDTPENKNFLDDQDHESDKTNNMVDMLNHPFGYHGLTLLHVAATECNKEAISLLLQHGADPCIRDGQGQLPYLCNSHKDTRNEFRRFMAKYPDKYDYTKAQIPGPLFEDQEQDKKIREAERRKHLKKIKKDRLKDQKAEEAKEREEEREKQRYLKLSDREKRAMAAEKRLTEQVVSTGQAPPVLLRCFQCAVDMTGKVPFEYKDYKFCTPSCLKQHRLANSTKKS